MIPSKWVHVDKNEFKKHAPDCQPKWKSRLVSRGNFEQTEGIRSDSPTGDSDLHMIITAWASVVGTKLPSADVSNAYFQSEPLDRVLLLRQPRGGLPQVDLNAALSVRVPVYGLTESGRSFWLRLSSDAKKAGLTPSIIYPAFLYKLDEENRCIAMLTTHVDDLLYSHLPEAKEVMDSLLGSYELGSLEQTNFRYCGKAFGEQNATPFIHTKDNTRTIKKVKVGNSQKLSDKLSPDQITKLRSVVGSLAWVARQGRPDLAYRVSYLQTAINGATVGLLHECNKVVDLAHKQLEDVVFQFPRDHLKTTDWRNAGIITVTDASFCNEKGFKSQQGRAHLLANVEQMKDENVYIYHVLPLGFSSATIKRVCRSTLQAETYLLQSGIESGDQIRALIAETKGCLHSRKDWESIMRSCVPHLQFSDCRSLCDHLDAETLAKVSDKRLGMELAAIHENLWQGPQRTWNIFPNGGDRLDWISTHTMLSDCLTKSMKPDLLLSVLRWCIYQVDKNKEKRRAER